MTLRGKTALITGSTSGIGAGIARAMAREDANIVLNGRSDPREVRALEGEIEALGAGRVVYRAADLEKPQEVRRLIVEADGELGGIDILVNNAGIQVVSPLEDLPEDRWDAIIAINLSSNFHSIKAALPRMREKGWGRIINIASTHGLVASANKGAYVAAKHGVVGLTKAAAIEAGASGITCNAICPGWVLTPLVERQIDDRRAAAGISPEVAKLEMLENTPTQDFTTPEQIGALAVFLCSPAAKQITGASLSIDGGWVAQ